jgi:energy-coupling factor transporter ATP-binding protein EcfA2
VSSKLYSNSIPYFASITILIFLISLGAAILAAPILEQYNIQLSILSKIGLFFIEKSGTEKLFFQLYFSSFEIGISIFTFFVLEIVTLFLFFRFKKIDQNRTDFSYVSGPKLLEFNYAISDATKKLKQEPGALALKIHPKLAITEQIEQGNIFISGQQGSGKSTIIKPMAKQIYKTGDISFTNDEKGEYQQHATENTATISLGGNIENFWNISLDIECSNDAILAATALIEEGNNSEQFFVDSARLILSSVIIYLHQQTPNDWTWSDLAKNLFLNDTELKNLLRKVSKPASILIQEGNKTSHSIRALLSSRLHWLSEVINLEKAANNKWSIKELIAPESKICHVFFKPNRLLPDLSKSICNAILTLLIERWLSREDSNDKKCWLILDELGQLPKNPSIIRWLTLSRSKNGRLIAGAQNYSMIYALYAEHSTETLLSLFRTVIVMRIGASGPSAQKASDLLGEQRVVTYNQSLNEEGKLSLSTQYHDRAVVKKEMIINLPSANKTGVVGYLFIAGLHNIYKLKWPLVKVSSPCQTIIIKSADKSATSIPLPSQPINRLNKRNHDSGEIA